jgi:Glycosyl hydrolases family 43
MKTKTLLKRFRISKFILIAVLFLQNDYSIGQNNPKDSKIFVPEVDGDWWPITGNPDLGELTNPKQQPVDFGIWQAKDNSWQLWSCIRSTNEPGKTRLFYGWEGKSITDKNWLPEGIKMKADPSVGETAGGLQAPYTFREGDTWYMFYGDWNAICSATSNDGKFFKRIILENQERVPAIFTEGAGTNTRDPMVIKEGDTYYCYYTGGTGYRDEGASQKTGAVYCRTSKDKKHWSNSLIVSKGGRTGDGWGAHECPFVVKIENYYYLFRTQRYGKENISSVYRSTDPLNFGVGTDEGFFVTQLPVAAPELVNYGSQWYIFALNPELNGIRVARLKWRPE